MYDFAPDGGCSLPYVCLPYTLSVLCVVPSGDVSCGWICSMWSGAVGAPSVSSRKIYYMYSLISCAPHTCRCA